MAGRHVLFVLHAKVIDQVGIEHDLVMELDGPRSGVRLGVVHRNLDEYVSVVHTLETLSYGSGIRHGSALAIEPEAVFKTFCHDDQRIAVPFSDGVSLR